MYEVEYKTFGKERSPGGGRRPPYIHGIPSALHSRFATRRAQHYPKETTTETHRNSWKLRRIAALPIITNPPIQNLLEPHRNSDAEINLRALPIRDPHGTLWNLPCDSAYSAAVTGSPSYVRAPARLSFLQAEGQVCLGVLGGSCQPLVVH